MFTRERGWGRERMWKEGYSLSWKLGNFFSLVPWGALEHELHHRVCPSWGEKGASFLLLYVQVNHGLQGSRPGSLPVEATPFWSRAILWGTSSQWSEPLETGPPAQWRDLGEPSTVKQHPFRSHCIPSHRLNEWMSECVFSVIKQKW